MLMFQALFRNSAVFLEKYISRARHVEVQIFGNGEGHVVHFGERECSVQRRHQKVIEEAPCSLFASERGKGEFGVSWRKLIFSIPGTDV